MKFRPNKLFSVLLAMLIACNLFLFALPPIEVHAAFSGGSGTASDPYLVSTPADFLNVSNYTSKHFRQTCDISFSGRSFTPISSSFYGTYDGGGFAITDISYNGFSRGIFSTNYGVIQNLSFRNCNITVNVSYVTNGYAGGIASINSGTISDCSFSGSLTAKITNDNYNLYAGCIAGKNTGTVKNCINYGNTLVSVGKMGGAGSAGVVGYNTGVISNCLNEGNVSTQNAGNTMCGGISGYNEGTIRSVKNTGNISGETCWHDDKKPSTCAYAGGIVGHNKGTVSYAQNYGTIETSGTIDGDHAYSGGIAGYNGGGYNDKGPYIVEYSKNYGQVLSHSKGGEARAGGIAGTVYKNSYVRYSCNEGYVNASDSAKYSMALAGGIAGNVMYGTASQCCNHGEVRANTLGYDSLEACGIAGGTNAVITDCYNDGNIYSDYRGSSSYVKVSGITVDTEATCQNCFNLGTLTTLNSGNRKYGIYSHDGAWDKNVIISCYSTNLYSNTNSSQKITDAQAKKKETFVGYDFNRIWAIDPNINGGYPYLREVPTDDNKNWYIDPSLIVPVTGIKLDKTFLSMIVGDTETLHVTVLPENALNKNIIWYSSTASVAEVSANGVVTANSAGVSYIYAETEDGGYLASCTIVVSDRNPVFSGGSGTASNPYLIATVEDLQNINYRRQAHYRLISNISLKGVSWTPIGTESNPFSGSFDGNGFTIDGLTVSASNTGYVGLFGYSTGNINNVILTNANISVSTDSSNIYCGGIAGYNKGSVNNCSVQGSIHGTTLWEQQNACVGGICGYSSQSISNCSFEGSIKAKVSQLDSLAYSGGIAGYGAGAVECRNYGSISSIGALDCDCYAGGIIGCATGNISSCYNSGGIVSRESRYSFAGGISGLNSGTVKSCKNIGSVYSYTCYQGSSDSDPTPPDGALAVLIGDPEALAGGITGSNYSTVSFCENLGAIHAQSISNSAYAGGIAGYNNASSILEDLKNSGSVLADSTAGEARAGGIASSSHHESMVRRCCNTGSVTITETGLYNYGAAGGIVAVLQYGTVTQCCNHGNVHATATLYEPGAGGILSSITSSDYYDMIAMLSDCYNDGTVSCSFSSSTSYRYGYLKGITGISDHGNIIQNCYNAGALSAQGRVETYELFKVWGNTSYTATGCYGRSFMNSEQNKLQSSYEGYDFTNVWAISPDINDGRPYLKTLPLDDDPRWYSGIEEIVHAEGIVLDKNNLELHIYEEGKLTATVIPENAINTDIIWTISDTSVAEVFQNGFIFAKAPGYVVVTVTSADGGFTASCYITVTDHSWEIDEAVEPTCTESGLTEGYHCGICGEILITQEFVPAMGHSWDNGVVTKEPTEETTGIRTYTCEICGETREETIPVLVHSHKYTESITKPSCTEEGYTTYTCDCGHSYIGDYVNAKGHTEVIDNALEATCTETGLTEGSHCGVCGEILVAQTAVPAKGHNFGEWYETKVPTETENGEKRRDCADCDHYETATIAMLSHSHDRWEQITLEAVAPTCTTTGLTEGKKCSSCGEITVSQQVIPSLGHKPIINNAIEATCTESGLTEGKHCSVCEEILIAQTTVPAKGHNFGEWYETKAPTETENGEKRRDCENCDTYETEIIAKLNHSHDRWEQITLEAVAPTCTITGLTEGKKCSSCGEITVPQEIIPALGHTLVIDNAVDATCTESGLTEGKHCSVCGEILVAQTTVPAKGHNFGEWYETKAPTETENGEKRRDCADCDHYETATIAMLSHSHDRWEQITLEAVAPTCTTTGLTEGKKCSSCGEITVSQQVIPSLGHKPVIDNSIDATCTESGLTEGSHCGVCGEILVAQTTVPAKGHNFGEWYETKSPTETENGEKRRDCGNCNTYETETIAKLNHSHDRWEQITLEAVAPTCTTTGLTDGKKCSSCGEITVPQQVIPSLGHKPIIDNAIDATCTESGLTEGSHCGVCGEILVVQTTVPAKGHNFGEWYETKAPTETQNGEKRRDCENCDFHETETIAKLNHSHDRWKQITLEAVAPTCTTTGLTEGKKCSSCGEITVPQEIIPALGHTPVIDNAVEPNCTETGLAKGSHCGVCGEILVVQTTVPAKGHNFGEWYETKAPTETENGEKRRDCGNCDFYETEIIAKLNHSHDRWEQITLEAVAPTCTTTGLTDGKKCSSCGEITVPQEIIPALGHTPVIDNVIEATCTQTGLTEGSHCDICGEILVAQTTVPAKGHSFDHGVITKEPTETETGILTFTCGICQETKTETIPSHSHIHNYEPVLTKPTCTEKGYTTYICACGDSYIDHYVNATGHTFGDWTVSQNPTCTEKGKEIRICANCDSGETREIEAKGHDYKAVITDPTCTEKGYTTHICACGESYISNDVEATGHSWNEGIITIKPTHETEGEKTFTCTGCLDTKTEVIAKYEKLHEIIGSDTNVKIEIEDNSNAILHENMILQVEKEDIVLTEQIKENLSEAIGKNSEILISYDISLMLEGVSVQPGGKVAITLPSPENIGEYSSVTVVFIDDNGNITPCKTKINDDGTITFITDHFSYYAIVGSRASVNTFFIILLAILFIVPLAGGLTAFIFFKKKKVDATETQENI